MLLAIFVVFFFFFFFFLLTFCDVGLSFRSAQRIQMMITNLGYLKSDYVDMYDRKGRKYYDSICQECL